MPWFLFFLIMAMSYFSVLTAQDDIEISKTDVKKLDVILLQDESLSMRINDPEGIRPYGAEALGREFSLAGEGNKLGLILFGAIAEVRIPLFDVEKRDEFRKFRQEAKLGFSDEQERIIKQSNQAYLTRDMVPLRMYTDIFGALQTAREQFDLNREDGNEKHVILFTDGKVDPWPGNSERYPDVAKEFLSAIKAENPAQRYMLGETGKYNQAAAEIDRARIVEDLVPYFSANGWRIHCVSFDPQSYDKNLFREFEKTNGNVVIENNVDNIVKAFKSIIPTPGNLIRLLSDDFCSDLQNREKKWQVNIDETMKNLNFELDFMHMFRDKMPPIQKRDIELIIIDPRGGRYSSQKDTTNFYFSFTKDTDNLIGITFSNVKAIKGTWQVIATLLSSHKICGHLEIKARRDHIIKITPEKTEFFQGSIDHFEVEVFDKNSKKALEMQKVEGKIIHVKTGQIHTMDLNIVDAGLKAICDFKFENITTGRYVLDVVVTDPNIQEIKGTTSTLASFKTSKDIFVKSPSPPTAVIKPNKLEYNIDIDNRPKQTEALTLALSSEAQGLEYALEIQKPILKLGKNELPSHWIEVSELAPTVAANQEKIIEVTISIPGGVLPAYISSGDEFKGFLVIHSADLEKSIDIAVSAKIKLPKMIINKEKLSFNHSWITSKLVEDDFILYHSSLKNRLARVTIGSDIYDSNDDVEGNIKLLFKEDSSVALRKSNQMEFIIPAGQKLNISILSALRQKSLNPELRLKEGTYRTNVYLEMDGIGSKEIPVEIYIPKIYAIEKLKTWLLWATILTGILFFATLIVHLAKRANRLFEGREIISFEGGDEEVCRTRLRENILAEFERRPLYSLNFSIIPQVNGKSVYKKENNNYLRINHSLPIQNAGQTYYVADAEIHYKITWDPLENIFILGTMNNVTTQIFNGFSKDGIVFKASQDDLGITEWKMIAAENNVVFTDNTASIIVPKGREFSIKPGSIMILNNFKEVNIISIDHLSLNIYYGNNQIIDLNNSPQSDTPIEVLKEFKNTWSYWFRDDDGNFVELDDKKIYNHRGKFKFRALPKTSDKYLELEFLKTPYGKKSKPKKWAIIFIILSVIFILLNYFYIIPFIEKLS